MEVKPIWQSKTAIMNVIIALAAFYPPVQEFIVGKPEMVAMIWSVVNIGMRLISKDKVSFY